MNLAVVDGVSSLVAAWPLVLVALVIVSLVGTAFVQAARPAGGEQAAGWGERGPSRTCRSAGHHYLKGSAGWRCSHCGDEIRHQAAVPQRAREVAGV